MVKTLDTLLGEPVESAVRRGSVTFDELAGADAGSLVLFGAGSLGKTIAAAGPAIGLKVLSFSDTNPALWGQNIDGIPVLSPEDAAARFGRTAVFVVSIWNNFTADRMDDRVRRLKDLGCKTVIPFWYLFWKHPDLFLPFYALDLPHHPLLQKDNVRKAFGLLTDDISRREYLAQLEFRLSMKSDAMGSALPDHYFQDELFQLTDREVLVDCGAFDGDTVRDFIERQGESWSRVVAFEPDPVNWSRLEKNTAALPDGARQKITILNQAVADHSGTVAFESTGTIAAAAGHGSLAVKCVRLDDALNGCAPTFIKFDIEGYELEALRGGHATITNHLPILAISSYHRQAHLWEIPLLISSFSDQYRFFLRPHGIEGWELVYYAVPAARAFPAGEPR